MKKSYYIFFSISIMLMLISTKSFVINTIIYSMAVIPMAVLLGEITGDITNAFGDKKGGLIAATAGNIPELTMGIWSLIFGMVPMVKAGLIGSILSNMLLVLGISIFFGGLKYKEQKFNRLIARTNFNMLFLAVSAMIIIASLNKYSVLKSDVIFSLSIKTAIVLISVYILGLIFSLYTHRNLFLVSENEGEDEIKGKGKFKLILRICLISVVLFFISEKLMLNINILVKNNNVSQEFMGIILIPILGNIGENFSAIMCAVKDRVNVSLEIAIGSSIQISLFVTPLLILLSMFMGQPMTFVFSIFQIIITLIALSMSLLVFADGKTYWFEGAILISSYILITLAYYYFQ